MQITKNDKNEYRKMLRNEIPDITKEIRKLLDDIDRACINRTFTDKQADRLVKKYLKDIDYQFDTLKFCLR